MSKDITQTIGLIKKDLLLDESAIPDSMNSLDEVKKKLIPVLNYLLNKDLTRLLNALYRIDINEAKVKHLLAVEYPDKIASSLAELIIQRELQKVITRRKYSNHS